MATCMKISASLLVLTILVGTILAKSVGEHDKIIYPSELDLFEDDGSLDTELINYLYAKEMIRRLRNNLDVGELRRKRSYWKQCAFNAVSCFGRK